MSRRTFSIVNMVDGDQVCARERERERLKKRCISPQAAALFSIKQKVADGDQVSV